MQKFNKSLFNTSFSHIYIEKNILNHPITNNIIKQFKNAQVIEINHYKDVFSRGHQNYTLQKQSTGLILAVKTDNLIYKGAKVCDDFGNEHFYYTSTMMNCIYDCEYCYLQGMYSSANIVVFVNVEDIFKEVEKLLKKHPVYLCISYDTDILAFENVIGYGRRWIEFAEKHNNLKLELRTKSANFSAIKNIEAAKNIILAFTLSPAKVASDYEHKAPSFEQRLKSIDEAIEKGWKVRLCFDPIIYIKDWEEKYSQLINTVFNSIDGEKITDVSIGVFRVSKEYLKKMRKQRPDSIVLNYPYETIEGISSYSNQLSERLISFVTGLVKNYISEDKIFVLKD